MALQEPVSLRVVALLVILCASGNAQAFFCFGKKDKNERQAYLYPVSMQHYAYLPRQSPVPPARGYLLTPPLPAYPQPVTRHPYPPRR